MENTTSSKPEVLIKPVILKAGVPLAVTCAGFIYAWIVAKRNISKKASSLSENEAKSSEEHYNTLMDHTSVIADSESPCLEQEITGLISQIEAMQIRELALGFQFDQYCDLKEQESVLIGEIKNKLSMESSRVEFLERENRRLENFVVQYVRVVEQLEYLKSENRKLQKKFQKLLRKSKAQSRLAKEQALKIKAEEGEILRSRDELQTKVYVVDKLQDEIRRLQRDLDQFKDEKNELLTKLDTAEKAFASKIESGDLSREDYNKLMLELEQVKKERADEVKELIFLRWTNACLKHELRRHDEQQNQDRHHKETEFGGSDQVIHYDSEHELHDDSLLEHHNVPSFDASHHSGSVCPKRRKLLERLKRWVEGSEKERVRHSVS